MTILLLYILYAVAISLLLSLKGYRSKTTSSKAKAPHKFEKILIVGATGGTGRELVKQSLTRGYEVTALVRDPARLGIEDPNLKIVTGDVRDPASVEEAVRGQQAVVSALGHKRFFYPTNILSDGTRNIINSMKNLGASRFICQTSLGIGDSAWRMGLYYTLLVIPIILPFYFFDKTRQERLIADSGLEWVIVRPGALNNSAKRDLLRHGTGVGGFLLTVRISRADVAGFMLDQLESNDYLGSAPGVSW
ncbi:MAG: SDR family oxidoreductase [Acidobacteriota bacterium]|nr:SDR family oxidoreductase [Acidobacteriota bacterium]